MRQGKMILTFMAACSLGIITTGCSSVNSLVGNDENRMVEVTETQVKDLQIPEWFIAPEGSDKNILVVTATDVSKDMQFAIDKATLAGTVQLAQKLNVNVKSLVQESTLENGFGDNDVDRQVDRVSKSRTDQDVGFYVRDKLHVIKEDGYYRAYVRLTLPINEGRRLTKDADSSRSREELMKELDDTQANADVVSPVTIPVITAN